MVFLVISLIAAALGYGGIASDAAEIAKILFFIFLGLWAVTLILALIAGAKTVWTTEVMLHRSSGMLLSMRCCCVGLGGGVDRMDRCG